MPTQNSIVFYYSTMLYHQGEEHSFAYYLIDAMLPSKQVVFLSLYTDLKYTLSFHLKRNTNIF